MTHTGSKRGSLGIIMWDELRRLSQSFRFIPWGLSKIGFVCICCLSFFAVVHAAVNCIHSDNICFLSTGFYQFALLKSSLCETINATDQINSFHIFYLYCTKKSVTLSQSTRTRLNVTAYDMKLKWYRAPCIDYNHIAPFDPQSDFHI